MIYLLLATVTAFVVSLWIISSAKDEDAWGFDTTLIGAQKFHTKPVPRIGGIVIFTALAVSALFVWWRGPAELRDVAALVLCGTPALMIGLLEDLTKRVSPRTRMIAIALSALLAWGTLNVTINRVDISWVDSVLAYSGPALILTLFAVSGVVNSINIIDGFHGLALMVSALMFAAVGFVAHQVGDSVVLTTCLSSIGALLGLFVWNYPKGRIFLGDGGAYFVGFMLAQCAIMLFNRNASVSPWFAILVLAYPTTETLFSIYRKRIVRKLSPMQPDRSHFHMLVFSRVVSRTGADGTTVDRDLRNARTSPYLWLLTTISVIPAVFFYDQPTVLMTCVAIFATLYIWLYSRIVSFKLPGFLGLSRARS